LYEDMVTYLFVTSVRLFVRQQLQTRRRWETVIPFMDLNYRRLITKTQRSGRRLCFHFHMFETKLSKKVNQSHYRPKVPRGFQEVKVLRLRDSGPGWW